MVEQPPQRYWRLTTKTHRNNKANEMCINMYLYIYILIERVISYVGSKNEQKKNKAFAWDLRIFVGCLVGWVCVALLDAWLVCRLLLFLRLHFGERFIYLRAHSNAINRTTYLELYTVCCTAANVVCSGFYPTLRVSHMCLCICIKSLKFNWIVNSQIFNHFFKT